MDIRKNRRLSLRAQRGLGHRAPLLALVVLGAAGSAGAGVPVLPDYTLATFGPGSSIGGNSYFPLHPGTLSIYEGVEDGVLERIERLVTFDTTNILGVENRVVRDTTYKNGLLVEVALDWYAKDTAGNVWYFGEDVVNYLYDAHGNPTGTNNRGSWTADGVGNFPGVNMFNTPAVGQEYYQEFAPGVAFDYAIVNSLNGSVVTPFGAFTNVLNTSEGNLFDGPDLTENKLFAPGIGLVMIQTLDDAGLAEFEIPLVSQTVIPGPASGALAVCGLALNLARRRR